MIVGLVEEVVAVWRRWAPPRAALGGRGWRETPGYALKAVAREIDSDAARAPLRTRRPTHGVVNAAEHFCCLKGSRSALAMVLRVAARVVSLAFSS